MKILCLNLKNAPDRRAFCEKQFEREGLDVTFIRGIHGRDNGLLSSQDWLSKQVGAFISHYMAVEEIRHNDYGLTLVLEDDIYLPENLESKLLMELVHIPTDFDVVCLSYFAGNDSWNPGSGQTILEPINSSWSKLIQGNIGGLAAYLVNGKQGAENIINCITPFRSHIDRMFWECCRDNHMKGYFINNPDFIKQGWDFPSQNI